MFRRTLLTRSGGGPSPAQADMESSSEGNALMTALTATTLGTVMLVVGVLVLAWGFPSLPRR